MYTIFHEVSQGRFYDTATVLTCGKSMGQGIIEYNIMSSDHGHRLTFYKS